MKPADVPEKFPMDTTEQAIWLAMSSFINPISIAGMFFFLIGTPLGKAAFVNDGGNISHFKLMYLPILLIVGACIMFLQLSLVYLLVNFNLKSAVDVLLKAQKPFIPMLLISFPLFTSQSEGNVIGFIVIPAFVIMSVVLGSISFVYLIKGIVQVYKSRPPEF
ncbi:MAG: hypothetical protein PHY92_07195 [Alphaproteobacteria bacterium]|nr:hypothetical protein [Alphaproteobacteria bacterium]